MADIEDLQRRVDEVLSGRGRGNEYVLDTTAAAETTPEEWFSEFHNPHRRRATELASRLMQIAEEKGGEEGLEAAVSEMEQAREVAEMPRLVQHATELFLTHYPEARAKLRLKPLEQSQPDLVRPSKVRPPKTSNPDTGSTDPTREQGL